jgi:curli production assembly/transport component CsgE
MKPLAHALPIAFCLLLPVGVLADDLLSEKLDESSELEQGSLDEIEGLILDRTITVLGHDFFQSFASYWRLNYPDNTTTFSIVERPTARFGSEIWIDFRGNKISRLFLSPSRSKVKDIAENVAENVNTTITQIKLTEMLRDTFDMDKGEL